MPDTITIDYGALDQMMPMHVIIGEDARVIHAGPTIAKILSGNVVGRSAFSLFELRRPRALHSMKDVRALAGTKARLRLKDGSGLNMVAALSVLPGARQLLMNLSFGHSIVDAVARYRLAGSDFAPTDLTVDMLFLVEAKSAAIEAATQLAHQFHGEKAEAQVEAMTDELTGLQNRRAFDVGLARFIAKQQAFSLMHIDLDFFKEINDSFGHAAGDKVLQRVANILTRETRESDLVARVGGDEFVVLLNRLTDARVLGEIADRIIHSVEQPILLKDRACQIAASIGIARSCDYACPNAEQVMDDADRALYQSKNAGRAQYTLFRADQASGAQVAGGGRCAEL